MDSYSALLSQGAVLNEQIARQVFGLLPEQGPIMILMNRDGHYWPSDTERFSKLNVSDSFLKELCAKIDDGDEPVVTYANDVSIIATQLATEHTKCGYLIIALPHYSPESTLANIDLIEVVLNQVSLIARLIERANLLHERQMKQFGTLQATGPSLN
jgi:hypothetical protein